MPWGSRSHPPRGTIFPPSLAMIRSASGPFEALCRNTTQISRPEEIASVRACSTASMIRASAVRRDPEFKRALQAGNESAASTPSTPITASNSRREKPFLTGSFFERCGRILESPRGCGISLPSRRKISRCEAQRWPTAYTARRTTQKPAQIPAMQSSTESRTFSDAPSRFPCSRRRNV